MKNSQKGFASILIILLGLVVVGGGVYLYTYNNQKEEIKKEFAEEDSSPAVEEMDNIKKTESTEKDIEMKKILVATSTQDELQKQDRVYSNSGFGFYITYPGGYVLSEDDNGQINLSFSSMRRPVIITESVGQADDSTGKWGKYVVSHSDTGWIVESANERDGGTTKQSIKPSAYTDSGLPIFNGGTNGHGWGAYGYIVALSENKFLIISGPDKIEENALVYNKEDDPTLIIAKRISVIK